MTDTHYRICPICEAACGLRVTADQTEVIEIRGNKDDVFSDGHVCAKGIALTELHADPDRITTPLIRRDGKLQPGTWADAYEIIAQELSRLTTEHGRDSVAMYVGNPTAHNIGLSMGFGTFAGSLGSKNLYTAGTVDQVPKQLACELMFGNDMAVPIPDVLNCDYFLMLGANPVVSNGSFWVVPKIREKLRALKQRGGKLLTVDPRRTETARLADAHHFIRPGTDAYFLIAIIKCLLADGLELPKHIDTHGAETLLSFLQRFDINEASSICGIAEERLREIAKQLKTAEAPVVYGRVGTTLQAFGTLTSFLIEVVNLLTGALDQRGGAIFPEQPFYSPTPPRQGLAHNRYQSRVSGVPEVLGQMPVTVLAEEIETPGTGQIRGLVCFAGNPVLSNPDSDRLSKALDRLEFLVCIDIYHNETSAKANVILPGSSAFEDCHYDQFLGSMGYRNAARYSPPVFKPSQPSEWDIGLTLAYIAQNQRSPSERELREFEDNVIAMHVTAHVNDPDSGVYQRDVQHILAEIEPEQGVERLLDLGIRAGRWGDHFGKRDGLTLKQLADNPNGIDLGEVREHRINELIQHPNQAVQLAPELILSELQRLADSCQTGDLHLIGRRTTRSNNTWLRNLTSLNQSTDLCDLHIHPEDADTRNIVTGEQVCITGPGGFVHAIAKLTDEIASGVVCLPHGFDDQVALNQSNLRQGPNYNRLTGLIDTDVPSGTAALNGIPVSVSKVEAAFQ